MSLISDGKALSKAIKTFGVNRLKLEQHLHTLACSAVALAAIDGRCDWLNDLHNAMSKAHQDSMRAWLGPQAAVFTDKKWITYTAKKGYSIIPQTVANRPTAERIEAVEGDFNLSFVHKPVGESAKQLDWDAILLGRIMGVVKLAHAQAEAQGYPVPASMLKALDELGDQATRDLKSAKLQAEADELIKKAA